MLVVDGNNLILGRAATRIAKELLKGEEVVLLNCEKLRISGKGNVTFEKYVARRRAHAKANPEHSAHWQRVPHLLVRRIIRGMLPWSSARGRRAFKRLRVHEGARDEELLKKAVRWEEFDGSGLIHSITVQQLCEKFGYRSCW